MNRLLLPLFVFILLGIAGGTAWYLVYSHKEAVGQPAAVATSTDPLFTGDAIYTNGTYGFALRYPEASEVEYSFSPDHQVGTSWRIHAAADSRGTALVSILPFATKSEDSYPRYFYALVRVGVSSDKKELASCTKPAKDQVETALPDEYIGGATWKVFAFEGAATMQYVKGVSYRTVFEGNCYAMEKMVSASNYRDDPVSLKDIPDSELEKHYLELDSIVHSFIFARPN
jgi:hypothetical protein